MSRADQPAGPFELRLAEPGDTPFLEDMLGLAVGWRDDTRAELTPELEAYVRGYRRLGGHGAVAMINGARDGRPGTGTSRRRRRVTATSADDFPEFQPHAPSQVQ